MDIVQLQLYIVVFKRNRAVHNAIKLTVGRRDRAHITTPCLVERILCERLLLIVVSCRCRLFLAAADVLVHRADTEVAVVGGTVLICNIILRIAHLLTELFQLYILVVLFVGGVVLFDGVCSGQCHRPR